VALVPGCCFFLLEKTLDTSLLISFCNIIAEAIRVKENQKKNEEITKNLNNSVLQP
jgi:branched-subunit amino acid permease